LEAAQTVKLARNWTDVEGLRKSKGNVLSPSGVAKHHSLEAMMEATTETTTLISASKVNGSAVYNTAGESIGKIYDLMIDKVSGKVAYGVMSFGGFLGMGESYHPLPWTLLRYDPGIGGYVINISKQKLEGAPNYAAGSNPAWGDRAYDEKVYGYYGTPPFWGAM
jgi:PRC-barrel domain